MQVLIPRQVMLPSQAVIVSSPQVGSVRSPQSGSSAGTLPQASSTSPLPGRNAVSAAAQSQAGSTSSRPLLLVLPRQVVLVLPSQEAVQALSLRQPVLVPSQGGMQAVQVLIPRQAAPSQGR